MKTIWKYLGIILATLCVATGIGISQTSKGYVDVHVHLRGTTVSGMLGNASEPRGQSGRSREELMRVATENLIRAMDLYGIERALAVVVPAPTPNEVEERSILQAVKWLAVINKFPDRMVIGSDEFFFPVESKRPNQSFEKTWSLLSRLPLALARKIGRDNALRIYGLE